MATSPSSEPSRAPRSDRRSTLTAVAKFAGAGLLALAVLAAGSVWVLRRAATEAAVRSARDEADLMASAILEPVLTGDVVLGDAATLARLDQVAARLRPTGVVRMKLWDAGGTIVYSDEPRLIGEQFALGEKAQVLVSGHTEAGVTDLDEAENRFEPRDRRLLEVYRPVRTATGQQLIFETYQPFDEVSAGSDRIWRDMAPIALGALVLLAAVQVPLAWSMARRLDAARGERERLLLRAVDAQEAERQRIARDLHDGVVQDLAGVSFTLAAAIDGLKSDVPPERLGPLRQAAATTRAGIRQLRTLLVELHPPNLATAGLDAALGDLVSRLASHGVVTEVAVTPNLGLSPEQEVLVYRAAQEAVRNAEKHAHATRVSVQVAPGPGSPAVLTVTDDGRGFDPTASAGDGHVGLRLLQDAAAAGGGSLRIDSQPGQGTRVQLALGPGR